MRTSDVDILIVPGWQDSGPDHWQSRWERNLKTARRVAQADWTTPRKDDWVAAIVAAVAAAERPAVLVAHSLGVAAVAHAAPLMDAHKVAGAFLVAAADLEALDIWPARNGDFVPVPRRPLPFPAALVASSNDPLCPIETSRALAADWGAVLVEAGDAGHINPDSGFGPWPDGLLRFGAFLKQIGSLQSGDE